MPVKRVEPVPSDIKIAQAAELIPIVEVAKSVGLSEDDIDLQGKWKAKVHLDVIEKFKDRPNGILLLTATPMQLDPVEVWDLLRILGLGGRWGAQEDNFHRYFVELAKPDDKVAWDFLLDLVRDHLDTGGVLPEPFQQQAEASLGLVDWETVRQLPHRRPRLPTVRALPQGGRDQIRGMAAVCNPLKRFMFRNTRTLLRQYREEGLLKENVPTRDAQPVWVQLRPEERELYESIEEYISDFYKRYEAERRGLGFVMTVYRRRLTSSFSAVRKSLERRLAFLEGRQEDGQAGLTEEDLEEADLMLDLGEELDEENLALFRAEKEYVRGFIDRLRDLGSDSKFERLRADLDAAFRERDTVLVFTQYTDTMDYLRGRLVDVHGSQVACYSGRGGERWNGAVWEPVTKEAVKTAFREGEVKILLCTEAASEGLNLQTCGVLINYDMPWNPMRVEQRIGRIDRIGQRFDVVRIRNYFYAETVEAVVYERLFTRIQMFEAVVGELQPVLGQVEKRIQRAALALGDEREALVAAGLDEIDRGVEARHDIAFSLDAAADPEPASPGEGALDLEDIRDLVTGSPAFAGIVQPLSELDGAWRLAVGDVATDFTFDTALYDSHPDTLALATYGSRVLDDLLGRVGDPGEADGTEGVLRLRVAAGGPASCAWYVVEGDQARRIRRLADLRRLVEDGTAEQWSDELRQAARDDFLMARRGLETDEQGVADARRAAERLALEEQARTVLLDAAYAELAVGRQGDVFDQALPLAFGPEAVAGLGRHKYPFAGLLRLVDVADLHPRPDDPRFGKVEGMKDTALRGRFDVLRRKASDLLLALAAMRPRSQDQVPSAEPDPVEERLLAMPAASPPDAG